ncbi:DUF1365 domain-containing protein [Cognatiyoonia sp. IB215182]|uniref:DUF1365 domain-containing protein n=1 Tax=Cognatiyoonia sp. IB215182 TaxID=3097353 RepID=UPI002A142BC5|nr:DUF1365 domain-containing protein [Cognatiyoonia sp. IB215182]MDX8355327.1 DUF1365 domain-containing protein [Cognatiyoonia sp. IB215182]
MNDAVTPSAGFYRGEVLHARTRPTRHDFRYNVDFVVLDLPDLSAFKTAKPVFGRNRFAPISFHDGDQLVPSTDCDTALDRLNHVLVQAGRPTVTSALLVTFPRFFGFGFSPVSFWFDASSKSGAPLLLEVNNTFGERHIYHLNAEGSRCHVIEKAFYVSPFNVMQGIYRVRFGSFDGCFSARVDLEVDDRPLLFTALRGRFRRASRWSATTAAARCIASGTTASPFIWLQGLKLRKKGLKPLMRPNSVSADTLISEPPRKRKPHQNH